MISPANDRDPVSVPPPSPSPPAPVIDLRESPTTRVRVSRDHNPFATLPPSDRMRLIIRVLCELVAYDELAAGPAPDHRRAQREVAEGGASTTRPTSITG